MAAMHFARVSTSTSRQISKARPAAATASSRSWWMPGCALRTYAALRPVSTAKPRPAPSEPAPACERPSAWRSFSTTLSTSRSI
jgi:hypothetical protein